MGVDCEPGANWLIQHYLHDCIYTPKDLIGFVLGMASILLWIIAQLPQFIDNIKNQSVDALSVWFLAQWFLGDTLNLLGCLMSGEQLPTTTALAMYFVVTDVLMLTQFVYYGALQRRKQLLILKAQRQSMKRSFHHHHQHSHGHSVVQHNGYQQAYLQQRPGRATMPCVSQPHTGSIYVGVAPESSGSTVSLPPSLVMLPGAAPRGVPGAVTQPQTGVSSGGAQLRQPELRPGSSATQRSAIGTVAAAAGALSLFSLAAVSAGQAWRGSGNSSGLRAHSWLPHSELKQPSGSSNIGTLGLIGHHSKQIPWFDDIDDLLRVLGTLFGSMSTVLYLGSRVSQIYKNWSRKSAEGLSVMMFVFTISANMCTGSSILLRAEGFPALQAQLPWLFGAFGTVGLDAFIYHQAHKYNKMNAQGSSPGGPHTAIIVQGEAHATTCNTAGTAASATTNPLLQPLVSADS